LIDIGCAKQHYRIEKDNAIEDNFIFFDNGFSVFCLNSANELFDGTK